MLKFTKHELELIYKGLISFLNLRTELMGVLDVKEKNNKKHHEYVELVNKITREFYTMKK